MRIVFTFILVFMFPILIFSQISKGDEYYNTYMYGLAKDYYEKARTSLSTKTEKAQVHYKLGYCYKMLGDFDKAEMYFKVAVANYERGIIKPDVLLFYADALRMNGKYEEAIEQYKVYIKLSPMDHRAKAGLESCTIVPKWLSRPTRYKVSNVSKFNSLYQDFSPMWTSRDYRSLYFTSAREGSLGSRSNYKSGQKFTDIFEITKDRKGSWSEPFPIGAPVNTEDDEGAVALSSKGNEMFFTRCKAGKKVDEPCKIFYATRKGNSWSEPQLVVFPGFDQYEVGYPALAPDDRTLYFSAETPEGFGGMDLYVSQRNVNSGISFSKPLNLGKIVNTLGDEVYTTIREDGTIYFASDGRQGMGGLDIYKIIKDEKDNIVKVENMKSPINSSYDDFGIIFNGKDESGYFSSNRKGGKGSDDIYDFYLPPLQITLNGSVRDTTDIDKIRNIKDAKLTLENEGGIVGEFQSGATGTFSYKLQVNQNYKIKAEVSKDYFSNSATFTTHKIEYDTVINVVLNLARIPRIIVLPNIEYEYDKADLKPESTVSLDKLVTTLVDNPNITIELRAHTDFRGADDYNMSLSLARAKSCVDYLIEKGIKSDRLTARGFGESEPRVINAELVKQHNYFKVGDVLTEQYINQLKDIKIKEAAHQLNRRTEFSVLSTDYGLNEKEQEAKQKEQNLKPVVVPKTDRGDF